MQPLVCEFAGKKREFQLLFGGVLDLEEAVGEGIGRIFIRLVGGQFKIKDVRETLRLSLIGGGMSVARAQILIEDHFDQRPLMEHAGLAGEILSALMTGVEVDDAPQEEPSGDPYKFSEVAQICTVFSMSPNDLRATRYADFVNMVRGYNAASETKKLEPISEEEFDDILRRYEPESVS